MRRKIMDRPMKEDAAFRDSYAVVERELQDEIERLTTENSILRDALLHIIDNDCLNAKWTANNALNTVSSQKS
jgi:hypothetical protein